MRAFTIWECKHCRGETLFFHMGTGSHSIATNHCRFLPYKPDTLYSMLQSSHLYFTRKHNNNANSLCAREIKALRAFSTNSKRVRFIRTTIFTAIAFFLFFFFHLFNFVYHAIFILRGPLLNDVKYFEWAKRHVNAENGQLFTVNTMFIQLNEYIWHLTFIKTHLFDEETNSQANRCGTLWKAWKNEYKQLCYNDKTPKNETLYTYRTSKELPVFL